MERSGQKIDLSVIVPVLNEQDSVRAFLRRCEGVLAAICRDQIPGGAYEILFIDDGSSDQTASVLAEEARRNPHVRFVRFSRNFGKEAALAAGLRFAAGSAVIPMDVDLQDPPEVLPRMVEQWLKGAEIVNAMRQGRDSDTRYKRISARLFYRLYNRIADIPIKSDVGDFRLLDRAVVDALKQLTEGSRFTKGLYSWVGYRNVDIAYDREERSNGRSKWGNRKLLRLASDGLIGSTTAPLRIWSIVGLFIGLLAFVYAGAITVKTLILGADTPGFATLMVTVLLLGGLNLLSLGILGEYVGRIAQEVRNRPLYVVRETHGISAERKIEAQAERPAGAGGG